MEAVAAVTEMGALVAAAVEALAVVVVEEEAAAAVVEPTSYSSNPALSPLT